MVWGGSGQWISPEEFRKLCALVILLISRTPWFLGRLVVPPFFWHTSLYIIYPFPVDLDPLLVYQASSYSYTCPISRFPLLFVSCSNRSHPVQASSLINMAGTFVGAFNAEVTYLPWTTPTRYPHEGPILLASSSGCVLGAAFDVMSFFPSETWDAEDSVILGCAPRLFGISLFVLGNFPPRHGTWALEERGSSRKVPCCFPSMWKNWRTWGCKRFSSVQKGTWAW